MRILLAIALAAAAPAVHTTAAGTKLAQSSLIKASELGKGWTGAASTQHGVSFSCKGHATSGKGIVEIGAASGPDLSYSKSGPFFSQETSVYRTAAQAAAYWRRGVTADLAKCAAANVEVLASKGVKVTIISSAKVPFKAAVSRVAEYRVVANANKLKLYFDVLVFGSGQTITSIAISSFQSVPPKSFEQGVARIVATHLGGPAA